MASPQFADSSSTVVAPAPPLALVTLRTAAGRGPLPVSRIELMCRTAELEAANRDLEAFGYSVSHDLQAPLRQIAGFTELLAREAGPVLSETARRHLVDIAGAAAHMTALVDALLEFSRAGSTSLKPALVDLDALARQAVRDASGDAAGRTIDWSLAPLPRVDGDPTLLRQVFANLLANAVKYTRARTRARIEIGTSAQAGVGEVVVFVRDNGIGFDMRHERRLFGVFERLHPSSEFEGSGVGLASVRRIVERHGGRVWATAAPGAGATFFVALPDGIVRAGSRRLPPRGGVAG